MWPAARYTAARDKLGALDLDLERETEEQEVVGLVA